MIKIYTRSTSILSKEFWKWLLRRLTRKYSGPNAVEDSLLRGLKELGVDYQRNAQAETGDKVIVLSGVQALREAIQHKESGKIHRLIAGPNVVTYPLDFDSLMTNSAIDTVLVPSEWVAKFWISEAPTLSSKIKVWPAGVAVTKVSSKNGKAIIYDKIGDKRWLETVSKTSPNAQIFRYGQFNRNKYLKALESAPYLIYLSKSESQGLALQEAWAKDVPTFVNCSTVWDNGKLHFEAPLINAPYLNEQTGAVFKNAEELNKLISTASNYSPKEYCDKHLSDKASTQILLNLL